MALSQNGTSQLVSGHPQPSTGDMSLLHTCISSTSLYSCITPTTHLKPAASRQGFFLQSWPKDVAVLLHSSFKLWTQELHFWALFDIRRLQNDSRLLRAGVGRSVRGGGGFTRLNVAFPFRKAFQALRHMLGSTKVWLVDGIVCWMASEIPTAPGTPWLWIDRLVPYQGPV